MNGINAIVFRTLTVGYPDANFNQANVVIHRFATRFGVFLGPLGEWQLRGSLNDWFLWEHTIEMNWLHPPANLFLWLQSAGRCEREAGGNLVCFVESLPDPDLVIDPEPPY